MLLNEVATLAYQKRTATFLKDKSGTATRGLRQQIIH